MIELTSTTAVMLYLGVTLGVLFGIWIAQNIRSGRKKIIVSEQTLFICEYCTFAYLADVSLDVTQCPQCSCFNKHNAYKGSREER